ncbi:Actin cytoskeleton-regulatory complex protein pan1, putative isoform [Thalictrum thalictroides]|uniref:Actin cytoskeleton-regulatory complex protein pan1, putative isoform n=1 Tax=Thalictrum thalictroides TaxID=46969 RepID=A0A7J6W408_THATH|nr:Actin cytoskeleton-regulatory complex protein pan1, putative isoform [Thalictrum thalictroides]
MLFHWFVSYFEILRVGLRGLGVAQLERIRIEEEQKNESTGTGIVGSSSSSSSSSFVVLPLPKHQNISSSSLHFPSPSPSKEIPSFRSNFRPKFEVFGQSPTLPSCPQPLPPPFYGHNTSFGSGSTIGSGHSYFPSVQNSCEMNYDRQGSKLHPGLMFHTHIHNEMNTIAPSSTVNGMQKQHYYEEQSHSSKVNVSNTNSSRLNVQIEPPSNQSYNSNCRLNPCPENEKMIGTKRQWPFSLDGPSSPSNCNYPPLIPRIPRLDERTLAAYENGGSGTLRFSTFREGPSGFSAQQLDWKAGMPELNLKNESKENGNLDTVLTLGISTASSSSTTKAKQPLECPASSYQEISDFNMSTHQEYYGDPLFRRGEPVQSQCLYNFFPPKAPLISLLAANSGDRRVGMNDCVDLDLKL